MPGRTLKNRSQIAASIEEFGWTNPILVAPDYVVIAGHARLAAAKKLRLTEVPVIVLGHLTEAQSARNRRQPTGPKCRLG
jgi:ParB-like chromosome segregation protein Spo0J